MPSNSVPQKTCNKCGRTLLATVENFKRTKNGKYGFRGTCRDCYNEYRRDYNRRNPEKKKAMRKRDYAKNAERYKQNASQWLKDNPERARETARERGRRYYQRHPGIGAERAKDYRRRNPEKARLAARVASARHESRKAEQPSTFTTQQWRECLKYWHNVCAYCGNQQGLWDGVLQQEHYIPVASEDCPGLVAQNIVPACRSCNAQKGHKHPQEWLVSKFGKRKAKEIMRRISRYFES